VHTYIHIATHVRIAYIKGWIRSTSHTHVLSLSLPLALAFWQLSFALPRPPARLSLYLSLSRARARSFTCSAARFKLDAFRALAVVFDEVACLVSHATAFCAFAAVFDEGASEISRSLSAKWWRLRGIAVEPYTWSVSFLGPRHIGQFCKHNWHSGHTHLCLHTTSTECNCNRVKMRLKPRNKV